MEKTMTKNFLVNLMLSGIWVALTGQLYYLNFVFGFVLGFFILWVLNRNEEDQRYFFRVPRIISFAFFFLYQILKANMQVAFDVITPKYFFKPGIVEYPMDAKTDFEINLLSTMLSLTPGTLILEVSDDKKHIYIHVMYLTDIDKFIHETKTGLERRLLEILR